MMRLTAASAGVVPGSACSRLKGVILRDVESRDDTYHHGGDEGEKEDENGKDLHGCVF